MINVLKDMKIDNSRIFTFENVRNLNIKDAINIENTEISYQAQKQFDGFDKLIKNR